VLNILLLVVARQRSTQVPAVTAAVSSCWFYLAAVVQLHKTTRVSEWI